jgi:hypothetical protein
VALARSCDQSGPSFYDRAGGRVGDVRDVRVAHERDGAFRVVGLVVGEGPLAEIAHAWGFAEGRASGPWLFRTLLDPASRQARLVPARRRRLGAGADRDQEDAGRAAPRARGGRAMIPAEALVAGWALVAFVVIAVVLLVRRGPR